MRYALSGSAVCDLLVSDNGSILFARKWQTHVIASSLMYKLWFKPAQAKTGTERGLHAHAVEGECPAEGGAFRTRGEKTQAVKGKNEVRTHKMPAKLNLR